MRGRREKVFGRLIVCPFSSFKTFAGEQRKWATVFYCLPFSLSLLCLSLRSVKYENSNCERVRVMVIEGERGVKGNCVHVTFLFSFTGLVHVLMNVCAWANVEMHLIFSSFFGFTSLFLPPPHK